VATLGDSEKWFDPRFVGPRKDEPTLVVGHGEDEVDQEFGDWETHGWKALTWRQWAEWDYVVCSTWQLNEKKTGYLSQGTWWEREEDLLNYKANILKFKIHVTDSWQKRDRFPLSRIRTAFRTALALIEKRIAYLFVTRLQEIPDFKEHTPKGNFWQIPLPQHDSQELCKAFIILRKNMSFSLRGYVRRRRSLRYCSCLCFKLFWFPRFFFLSKQV